MDIFDLEMIDKQLPQFIPENVKITYYETFENTDIEFNFTQDEWYTTLFFFLERRTDREADVLFRLTVPILNTIKS